MSLMDTLPLTSELFKYLYSSNSVDLCMVSKDTAFFQLKSDSTVDSSSSLCLSLLSISHFVLLYLAFSCFFSLYLKSKFYSFSLSILLFQFNTTSSNSLLLKNGFNVTFNFGFVFKNSLLNLYSHFTFVFSCVLHNYFCEFTVVSITTDTFFNLINNYLGVLEPEWFSHLARQQFYWLARLAEVLMNPTTSTLFALSLFFRVLFLLQIILFSFLVWHENAIWLIWFECIKEISGQF